MRIFYLLVMIFCLVRPAFAGTQYWYVTPTGAGGNARSTGAWNVLPNSAADAMSAANFNSTANWSATEDANKIDPNDVIYVKGAGWTSTAYDLVPVYGCTIDGWETGTFDPSESSTWEAAPVMHWSRISVNVDNVTIRNMRFKSSGGYNVIYGMNEKFNFTNKTSGHLLKNNYWNMNATSGTQLRVTFINDSEISYNYAVTESRQQANQYRRWLSFNGGSRNRIIHNTIIGGITGLYFNQARILQHSPVPSSGSYRYDPDYNMQYNEIAYNTINRDHQGHEGLSFDSAGQDSHIIIWERDTIASINHGNPRIITLSHPGFATAGKDYSGTFLVNISDSAAKYGRHSLIAAQRGATITLENEIPNLEIGDLIVIGHAWRRNWIHNNVWPEPDRGFAGLSLNIEGMSLENIIENNTMYQRDTSYAPSVYPALTMLTYTGAYIPKDSNRPWNDSVTQLPSYIPTAFNITRNNTIGRVMAVVYHQTSQGHDPLWISSYNNAFYDNTILNTSSSGGYRLTRSHVYIPASEASKIKSIDANSSILEIDPTDDSWLTDKVRVLHSPKGFSIQPK